MPQPEYAVVDIETTGLFTGRHDRVVEIAVVHVDRHGATVNEWCSLVNPQRDLGPQHIHGIRAREVLSAPTFADIAGDLAALLSGRVVVAHNLSFDIRFLAAEYARLGHAVPLSYEDGLCTMSLSGSYLANAGRSLAACCAAAGVRHTEAHSAMHDARACAALLARFIEEAGWPEPWQQVFTQADRWPALPPGTGRTATRRPDTSQPAEFLALLVDRLPRVPQPARADDYLALLDRALLDRQLSTTEQDALVEVAHGLNLTYSHVLELHRDYLTALAAAAWADRVVTDAELQDLNAVANLLGLTAGDVDIALHRAMDDDTVPRRTEFRLQAGDVVAFTGQLDGTRDEWEDRATRHGLVVTGGGVTKRTRLLVAADPDSLSGKAGKARKYGIPIVTAEAFGALLGQMRDLVTHSGSSLS